MQLDDLSFSAIVAAATFSVCMTGLILVLLLAPRRKCFFLRWHPETRLLALMAAPLLLILWPVALVVWLTRNGVLPEDPDFYDD